MNTRPANKCFPSLLVISRSKSQLLVKVESAKRFIIDCCQAVGTCHENAEIVADNLLTADTRGFPTQGIAMLDLYIKRIQNNLIDPNSRPEIVTDNKTLCVVDSKGKFGPVVGKFAMNTAITKAKQYGISMVTAFGTNTYGLLAVYALQAIRQGFVGLACSNFYPILCSLTGPITLNDDIILGTDVSFPPSQQIPSGHEVVWDLNDYSQPEAMMPDKPVPLGGILVQEIFALVFAKAAVPPRDETTERQCFLAIDGKRFVPGFEERLREFLEKYRAMPPMISRIKMVEEKCNNDGFMTYTEDQLIQCAKMSRDLHVQPLKVLNV